MAYINENFLKLKAGYLFPEIARRVKAFAAAHPNAKIIRMGIGDVTEPLPPACVSAMHKALDEMSSRETFRGYPPEQGYDFLREAIAQHDFQSRNCDIAPDDIFVSDGSKCDGGNLLDIFGHGNAIAVTDPVYPIYVDDNVMAGNTGPADPNTGEYPGLLYLRATAANNFTPELPTQKVDLIYLCYPNNPTGTVASKEYLTKWVNYAKANKAVIIFDAAYEAYIADPAIPHSIYEIPDARDVAIELRSFSKLAGFTGIRCGYTVVPKSVQGKTHDGQQVDLHRLWLRRHTTKFNGVSYITQRGAEASYSPEGKSQIANLISYYKQNAQLIRESLTALGLTVHGGQNAPYVWLQTPNNIPSWQFFDQLLNECHVVGTPGSGFGASGEGYLRLSSFNSRQNVETAMARLQSQLKL